MSKVLAVNAGSSSLKFTLYEMPQEETLTTGIVERIGFENAIFTIRVNGDKVTKTLPIADHAVAVNLLIEGILEHKIIERLDEIVALGHRVVHGGEAFKKSTPFTEDVYELLQKELVALGPLHMPPNLLGYRSFKDALPNAAHTAIFDTAFHQTMEEEYFIYPFPYEFYTDHKVRRYGFHGTSHLFVSRRLAELMNKDKEEVNIITLHLGSGASIAAVEKGKVVNTSMGFTPLAGIMMGTRTGDFDPSIIPYMMKRLDISVDEFIDVICNKKSGLLGVSGISSDARDIQDGVDRGDHRAILAQKLFANRVAAYVGEYFVQMGRVDGIVFTGGIGENDVVMRELILERIKDALQITYDASLNASVRSKEVKLTLEDSKVDVWLVPTDEEIVLARDAYANL